MTKRRAKVLADIIGRAAAPPIVVEDDHSGDIATGTLVSLGQWLPATTVHIRSYSKSHGPDLRLAAVGGAGDVVAAVANRRLLGPGWSSRILQAVLFEMLDDPATIDAVDAARAEYARAAGRRCAPCSMRMVCPPPAPRGSTCGCGSATSASALLTLAAQGIGAAPGEPFMVRADHPHIRVTVGLVDDADHHVAEQLAEAAAMQPSRAGHR